MGIRTNCAGIAGGQARIIPTEIGALTLFESAREAYHALRVSAGLHFDLLGAAVSEVDANERKFREIGLVAMTGWLKRNAH